MAKIKTKGKAEGFNGNVGPVRFTDGEAETDNPSMLAHFRRDPKRYEVTATRAEQKAEADAKAKREAEEKAAAEKAEADRKAAEDANQGDGDKGTDPGKE